MKRKKKIICRKWTIYSIRDTILFIPNIEGTHMSCVLKGINNGSIHRTIMSSVASHVKYYDIGLNLTDPMFQGTYHGKKYHESDIQSVLNRAQSTNVNAAMLTGSSILESKEAIQLAKQWNGKTSVKLFYTIGVHPCTVNEFALNSNTSRSTIDSPSNDEEFNEKLYHDMWNDLTFAKSKLKELYNLMQENLSDGKEHNNNFKAIGEIGLDYDRFHYSCKDMQKVFFEEQLKLSCLIGDGSMPLFLHMRNCSNDFIQILKKFIIGFVDNDDKFNLKDLVHETDSKNSIFYKFHPNRKFVVHSFTDSIKDLNELLELSQNCYIGMNGASFKTNENIECAKAVPLNRLLLETDSPWCEMRRTHESWQFLNKAKDQQFKPRFKSVKKEKLSKLDKSEWDTATIKSRNEPCTMENVAQAVANIKNISLEEVVETVWETSCSVYGD